MQTWADVAILAKTKSLEGRFVARSATGLPFLLEVGDEVAIVPPQLDAPRRVVVSDVRLIDDVSAEVAFEGVDAETASILVGCHCLLDRSCIDESLFEANASAWEGWMVHDIALGPIGSIEAIIDNPAHALLQVVRDNAAEVLIPVVDEIVVEIDAESRTVHVNLPQGLLDLNEKSD